LGLLYNLIPQEYLSAHPGEKLDEDPGWADLEEKWLRPKIPRPVISELLAEKRTRLAKEEEEVKKTKATRKRESPKSKPVASPSTSKEPAQKTRKKTPKQQLLQFPKSSRTGLWGFTVLLNN